MIEYTRLQQHLPLAVLKPYHEPEYSERDWVATALTACGIETYFSWSQTSF